MSPVLYVVGLGPGAMEQITQEAQGALARAPMCLVMICM